MIGTFYHHLAVICAGSFLLTGSLTASAADIEVGKTLAERWCSSCHLVSDTQQQANADVASFSSIARKSNFSREALAFFLLDPHPKMPPLALSRVEADNIAAYIASLAR